MSYKRCSLNLGLSQKSGRYISIGHLSRILGVSRGTMYNKLRGKTKFTPQDIERIMAYFVGHDVTRRELLIWIRQSIKRYARTNSNGAPKEGP